MQLRHVGIVVQDIVNCRRFWTDVCGFNPQFDGEEEGKYLDHLLGKEGVKIAVCKLRCQHSGVMVELIQPISHRVEASIITKLSQGITHIALTVDNISETLNKLEQFTGLEQPKPEIPPDGRVKVAYAYGPENVILELVELTPWMKD